MKRVLIGIHGKPRAGKDTLAHYLRKKYHLMQYGPSVAVKATTAAMFDVPIENFYDDSLKETVDPFWKISYREMAQRVGKESSRDVFGDDIWMRHVEKRLNEVHPNTYRGIILADIRYENEVEWVRNHGGIVLFITRENRSYVANETHVAEAGLPLHLADVIIPNNSTIEALYTQADLILGPLVGECNG